LIDFMISSSRDHVDLRSDDCVALPWRWALEGPLAGRRAAERFTAHRFPVNGPCPPYPQSRYGLPAKMMISERIRNGESTERKINALAVDMRVPPIEQL
jgi:hypothetical protein